MIGNDNAGWMGERKRKEGGEGRKKEGASAGSRRVAKYCRSISFLMVY
jgi:hypothetical protein